MSEIKVPASVREMNIIEEWAFSPSIKIASVEKFPENDYKNLVDDTLTTTHPFLRWQESLDAKEKALHTSLKSKLDGAYKLRLAAIQNGELVALSFSFQTSSTEIVMGTSTLRPDVRGQGLYTALAKKTIELTKREGFQSVSSKHLMTNNPILIAKLKLGFQIRGMEVDGVHGALLHMVYNHNPLIQKAFRFRVGELAAFSEDDILEYFGSPL